jgi:hypothetical protein
MTYQEIAKTLGITPSRVCQLLWRAVKHVTSLKEQPTQSTATTRRKGILEGGHSENSIRSVGLCLL